MISEMTARCSKGVSPWGIARDLMSSETETLARQFMRGLFVYSPSAKSIRRSKR
jgi:hypothetical protein